MQQFKVDIIQHEKTGLLVATSDDLPGLYAHGRTMEDLEKAIAVAIKDILEAKTDRKVQVKKRAATKPSGFFPREMTFAADGALAA